MVAPRVLVGNSSFSTMIWIGPDILPRMDDLLVLARLRVFAFHPEGPKRLIAVTITSYLTLSLDTVTYVNLEVAPSIRLPSETDLVTTA